MRSPSPWIAAAVVAAVVALGVVLDDAGNAGSPAPEPTRAGPASSGAWVCAAGDTTEGRSLRLASAVPPDGTAALLAATVFADGEPTLVADGPVSPGAASVVRLEEGTQTPGALVRWWEHPAATTRLWRLTGPSTPAGFVAGPCQSRTATRWVIPGMATAGGATARLVLANPFETGASVRISIATPTGLRQPRLLENIAVPGNATRTVPINEHAPAQADLGLIVTARSGRVVAEGVQLLDAAIGGVDGTTLATAASRPATSWTVPWVTAGGEGAEGWLWVTNPSDRSAVVTAVAHTAEGGVVPPELGETTVPPGEVRRISLGQALGAANAGVTVTAENDVPVVVSSATRIDRGPRERTGLAVQLGAPEADTQWTLAGPAGQERHVRLQLANPGSGNATVDVTLWAGSSPVRPDGLQGVAVPAGGATTVAVPDEIGAAPVVAAFVEATTGQVVAGMRTYAGSGRLGLAAYPGTPSATWDGGGTVPPVRHAPGLAARIGTSLGPQPAPGEAVTEPEAAPTAPVPTGPGTAPSPGDLPTVVPTGPPATPVPGTSPPG